MSTVCSPLLRLEMKITKSSGGMPRLSYTGRDDRHFLPSGLYIIKTVNGERVGRSKKKSDLSSDLSFIFVLFFVRQTRGQWRSVRVLKESFSTIN